MLDFGWLAACGDDSLCARDSGRPTRAGCPGAVAACRRRRLGEVGRAARRFAAAYVRIFLTLPSRLTRPGGHLSGRPVRTSRAARQGSGATIPRARLAVGQAELHRVPGRARPLVSGPRSLARHRPGYGRARHRPGYRPLPGPARDIPDRASAAPLDLSH